MQGEYLFIHYGFSGDDLQPQLTLHSSGKEEFDYLPPMGQELTLSFDTIDRFCTGWHDLSTSDSFPCPDAASLPPKFSQCHHCQQKTGFNPAFYHAQEVSPQQQIRNSQPHFLYLAHFGPAVVKVGISWSGRGIKRLLEQGARSCLIIKEFPTATVARQYEAKIAALPGIAETLQVKTKCKLLSNHYDFESAKHELLVTKQIIEDNTGLTPDDNQPLDLQPYYSSHNLSGVMVIPDGKNRISGTCVGMIGGMLLAQQDDQLFCMSLSSFLGYKMTISNILLDNEYAPIQTSLF